MAEFLSRGKGLRRENYDPPEVSWTPTGLPHEVKKFFGDTQLCVVANREPYVHKRKGAKIEILLPASRLVTALEPIVRACSGLWSAHGSGTADRETADWLDVFDFLQRSWSPVVC